MRHETFAKAVIVAFATFLGASANGKDYQLETDEVKFLKRVFAQDKLLKELPSAHSGLQALNTVLKLASPTPIGIALTWNQVAISGWRVANTKLAKLGKQSICEEIDFMILTSSKNKDFFKELSAARGCEDGSVSQFQYRDATSTTATLFKHLSDIQATPTDGLVIYGAQVQTAPDGILVAPIACSREALLLLPQASVTKTDSRRRTQRCPDGNLVTVEDIRVSSAATLMVASHIHAQSLPQLLISLRNAYSNPPPALASQIESSSAGLDLSTVQASLDVSRFSDQPPATTTAALIRIDPPRFDPPRFDTPRIELPKIPKEIEPFIPFIIPGAPPVSNPIPPVDSFNLTYPMCAPVRQIKEWGMATEVVSRARQANIFSTREQCRDITRTGATAVATKLVTDPASAAGAALALTHAGECACNWEYR